MPPALDSYPYEVQLAFFIYSLLQDTWDGMSGMYMGKNMSGLGELLDIYEIEDKKTVVFFYETHRSTKRGLDKYRSPKKAKAS